MDIPDPQAGLVIRYSYLWHDEKQRGVDEGSKDRPCAVVLAVTDKDGKKRVMVAPITHTEPDQNRRAIALPSATSKRLGLDDIPQWIVTDDVNLFTWPGFDIRAVPQVQTATTAYGFLPQNLTADLIAAVRHHTQNRSATPVERDE